MTENLKQEEKNGLELVNENPDWYWLSAEQFIDKKGRFNQKFFSAKKGNPVLVCPYGSPGDMLWVRESWRIAGYDFDGWEFMVEFKDGSFRVIEIVSDNIKLQDWLVQKFENSVAKDYLMPTTPSGPFVRTEKAYPFSPSIHMPFEAARLFLRIKTVRAERLQNLTDNDALAEGIRVIEKDEAYFDYLEEAGSYATPKGSFMSLWQKINGQDSWNANPWVWVIEFELSLCKEEALKSAAKQLVKRFN